MVIKERMMAAVRAHLRNILLVAEAALPGQQFEAFRKLVLNEFGKSGLEGELDRLLGSALEQDRPGQGRNT